MVLVESNILSFTCSKQLHLRPILPSEVWATIFDYAGYKAGPLQPDQISRFRLLSRSITAGLDEWLLLEMDQGVERNGSLQLVRNASRAPVPVHKLGLLALSKAPTELFPTITELNSSFLTYNPWVEPGGESLWRSKSCPSRSPKVNSIGEQTLNSALSQLSNVTHIGACFLSSGGYFKVVDLRSMTQLTTIGYAFLCSSFIDASLLPSSLKRIGCYFLNSSSIKKVDLSQTRIETVGDYFLSGTDSEVLFPQSLKTAGSNFLRSSSIKKVDLSQTCLESVGDCFLYKAKCDELVLPPSFKVEERCFLVYSAVKKVDLSHTGLKTLRECFLYEAKCDELLLPPSLETAGIEFLSKATITINYCFPNPWSASSGRLSALSAPSGRL
jgi:hypothetical protein